MRCHIDYLRAVWNRYFGGVQQPGVLTMPGNPEECRRHALECVRLAQATSIPQRREYFAKLAATWIELAEELERDRELLDDDKPYKRTG